ncbi:hypothetical protein CBS101457_002723 [Exobasidium rhododendri]|nr:hypothetical protein CBS101457_002723 [Exobasidium rhododendri]
MKVHVHEWSAVGYWVWDVKDEDDICGICQNAFDGVCGTCDEPGDQCPLLFGTCSHIFHMHCIIRWIEKMNQEALCPLCKRPWQEVTAEENQAADESQQSQRSILQERVPEERGEEV